MLTGGAYQPLEQAELLQAIEELGAVVSTAVVSTWIGWLFVASAFPATSQARYLTVVVVETVKGPVYKGLAVVGVEPSVV
jgi:type IV secretory pathway VirB2 component (pilin)